MPNRLFNKTGRTLKRRRNSTNGNPSFWVTFADGTRFATPKDAFVNHVIANSEYDGDVTITLGATGEIIAIEAR